jgi:hypothetical protein
VTAHGRSPAARTLAVHGSRGTTGDRLLADTPQEAKRGLGTTAVFIARNRFAVLDKGANQIQIRNLQNEVCCTDAGAVMSALSNSISWYS